MVTPLGDKYIADKMKYHAQKPESRWGEQNAKGTDYESEYDPTPVKQVIIPDPLSPTKLDPMVVAMTKHLAEIDPVNNAPVNVPKVMDPAIPMPPVI